MYCIKLKLKNVDKILYFCLHKFYTNLNNLNK